MIDTTLLFYLLCCIFLCVPSFGTFSIFPVSRPIPDFYAKIPTFYANILCYLVFYVWYRAWCAEVGGGPCVARRLLQPHTWCYQGMQFNLLAQYLIMGLGPAPIPVGHWAAELCESSMIRTSQRRLRCVRLPPPPRT